MSSPLSGFTAVPNPQMLSFMPIQSYLMMYFAGAGWQIGKRKISAIPNDQFNKMSAKDLLEGFTADLRETIPTLERSLQDVTPLVRVLIEQYGDFMKEILKVTPVVSKDVLFGEQGIFSPTEIGNKALIDDIMKFLRNQFPSLPKGFADAPQTKIDTNIDPNKFKPSTISGLSVLQAQQRARDKQAKHEEELREKAKLSIELLKTKQPVPQVFGGVTKFKKKAGQSQIFERKRLISLINAQTKRLKFSSPDLRIQLANSIRNKQQSLVNLLDRYSF